MVVSFVLQSVNSNNGSCEPYVDYEFNTICIIYGRVSSKLPKELRFAV